ncbi:hypothetical protein [Candidatus Symbiopectobacterium sp. 'North America']|uniref:hypothetical protein n=1 Tax=Candidatus Symbiopectobacterium sp. 'North America' TaxID=2794574 RepID=UPI0018C979D4|nr:hypothetical protein [Candidatus Symbiopectobacterium sp. 'North America']
MSVISAYPSALPLTATYNATNKVSESDAVLVGRQKSIEALASVDLTLSPEALARLKEDFANATPPSQEEQEAAKKQMLEMRNTYLDELERTAPGVTHPLYSTVGSDVSLTDFRAFFALAPNATRESTRVLADALYDAVTTPLESSTDSTQAAGIALMRETLDFINSNYIPEEYQAQVRADIDNYMERQLTARDKSMKRMLDNELDYANFLKDEPRIEEAQENVSAYAQGNYCAQRELGQMMAISESTEDTQVMADKLTQWYSQIYRARRTV